MKRFTRLFFLLGLGLTMLACGGDDPEDIPSGSTSEPSVTAPVVSSVTDHSAMLTATAKGPAITGCGICYGTSANPDINGDKMAGTAPNISLTLSGLTASTTYHTRTYVQFGGKVKYSSDVSFTTSASSSSEDEEQTEGPEALKRVSVHDPSVVWDASSGNYYIFGSHRAAARSTNMMTWLPFTAPWQTANSNNAANAQAFTTPQITKVKKGGADVNFAFDAMAWSKRGSTSYNVDGNMWAPDVVYNKAMNKWCMYLSINGDRWYSSIILLTADKITGPYRYQAPVVISGFASGNSYKDTDLEIVLGSQNSLPSRYAVGNNWGRRYPNCIDPCVFYDEQGKLWMTYGSWSGGIWMLELDENTGLRDYDVNYTLTGSGDGVTIDPYFGKKIAGGYYVSGEASYIEYIGGYYFLFMTYGGLAAGGVASDYNNGGYQMRVFRSKNPDGPYLDSKNSPAVFSSYLLNFGAKEDDGNRGVNIFGAYSNWGNLLTGGSNEASGERSQGHNSIIAAEDGRTYLVYHTRFQNWGEGHQVRVHQVFQNEDGWLVAAPFEYTGERVKSADIATKQKIAKDRIPGKYKILVHEYKLDHTRKAYSSPKDVTLNADGTISGDYSGRWTVKEGSSFVTIDIGQEYKGVFVEQTLEPKNEKAPCFTALRSATGVTVWGYRIGD
jgi:arabinan endo-1,5-alpha-L-arabinosidase